MPNANGFVEDDVRTVPKLEQVSQRLFRNPQVPRSLQRTRSQPQISQSISKEHYQYRWPRHLSFSVVVDVIAASDEMASDHSGEFDVRKHADSALTWEKARDQHAQQLNDYLQSLQTGEGVVVERRVGDIEDIELIAEEI